MAPSFLKTPIAAVALAALAPLAVAQPAYQSVPTEPISAGEIAAALGNLPPSTKPAIVLPVAALEVPAVAASVTPIVFDPETGIAMEGYDPVGYFTQGEAMKGYAQYTAEYQGATFQFVSSEHREMFLQNPERYAPAHGGYCTQTLAAGGLTPASPTHWTVHGNRLFLTRSAASTKRLREDIAATIATAGENWAIAQLALHAAN